MKKKLLDAIRIAKIEGIYISGSGDAEEDIYKKLSQMSIEWDEELDNWYFDGARIIEVDAVRRQFRFKCKYCKAFHYHGLGEGHRVAHCDRTSPYKKHGYILRLKNGYKWCVTSICPPELSRAYFESESLANSRKAAIDEAGCGGQCSGKAYHIISVLKVKP